MLSGVPLASSPESLTPLYPPTKLFFLQQSFFSSSATGPQFALLAGASRTREDSWSLGHRRTFAMYTRAPATSPVRDQPRLPLISKQTLIPQVLRAFVPRL